MAEKKRVLFLCTGNSCRSQMAEGYLRAKASDRFEAFSAGSLPTVVNPLAIDAMEQVGIDISRQRSKSVDEFAGQRFDYVITVCSRAAESCPTLPSEGRRLNWPMEDPAGAAGTAAEIRAVFARVRDQIARRIDRWLADGE